MATSKTDSNGYSNLGSDSERDMGAKGGPATTLGNPDDNHGISHPYSSDTQTQLAAASTQKKKPDTTLKDDLTEEDTDDLNAASKPIK